MDFPAVKYLGLVTRNEPIDAIPVELLFSAENRNLTDS